MKRIGEKKYDHTQHRLKRGVLLSNLGTPDAPKTGPVRRYLREFLSDNRVVEIPRLVWLCLLYLIILPFRPAASAKKYRKIWTENGSPLLSITQRQAEKLQRLMDERYGENEVLVEVGMRYGNPGIQAALERLRQQNVRHLVVLPLYPQYSGSTIGSTFDAVAATLTEYRWVPQLTLINGYHNNFLYIEAITRSIRRFVQQHGWPDQLLLSFHGLPQRYLQLGDPYYCFCMQTSRLVAERLAEEPQKIMTTFQSRFGRTPWLEPYTDVTLTELAKQGIQWVAVVCPGFAADCLETLEEIDVENRAVFLNHGGTRFDYIPCLNDGDEHIDMLSRLVAPYLEGGCSGA